MSLLDFLKEHSFQNNSRQMTHISTNGGKYSISLDENDKFLKLYLDYINTENVKKVYISECILPGKLFNLMLDIEFKKEYRRNYDNDEISNKIIHETIYEIKKIIFENTKQEAEEIVASRSPYLFHVYFKDTLTNIKEAKFFLEKARNIMEEKYPDIDWKKSLDSGIYRGSGSLRMLGSYSKKTTLEEEFDFYRPILNGKYKDITIEYLQKCTIRTEVSDPKLDLLVYDPDYVQKEKELDVNDDIIINYLNSIKNKFPDNDLDIFKIKSFSFQGSDSINIHVKIKDKFCPFVNRTHRRKMSPLYLNINKYGCHMKCFDEDCNALKFPEKPIKLNKEIKDTYFVDEEKDTSSDIESIPEGYSMNLDIIKEIECSLTGTHYDIARFVYYMYKDKFRVDTFGSKATWYEFKNHRLYKNSNLLGILLSEDLINYYKLYVKEVCESKKNESIDMIIRGLKTVTFKSHIIVEASHLFFHYNQDFLEKMDSNQDLICFSNGILDLENNEFRDGHIEDCITLCTKKDYVKYDPNNIYSKQVMKFLKEVFTDPTVLEYQLMKISQCLSGRNQQQFNIWTGNGSNGKSKVCELIQKAFGDYWAEMPVTMITKQRSMSSQASPDIMKLKGRRIVTIEEPEAKDKLQMGLIKQLTGGDTVSARELHKSQEEFKLHAKLFFSCNFIPVIDASDGGTWRRVKIVEFESKFVENPKKDHEFLKDPNLDKKINYWGEEFLSLLVHYYYKIPKEGIKEPYKVRAYTEEFRRDHDIFTQFVENSLEESKELTSLNDVFTCFQEWCNNKGIPSKVYTKTEIKKLLGDLYGREKKIINGTEIIIGFSLVIIQKDLSEINSQL